MIKFWMILFIDFIHLQNNFLVDAKFTFYFNVIKHYLLKNEDIILFVCNINLLSILRNYFCGAT